VSFGDFLWMNEEISAEQRAEKLESAAVFERTWLQPRRKLFKQVWALASEGRSLGLLFKFFSKPGKLAQLVRLV
jgi:hypothetical protein